MNRVPAGMGQACRSPQACRSLLSTAAGRHFQVASRGGTAHDGKSPVRDVAAITLKAMATQHCEKGSCSAQIPRPTPALLTTYSLKKSFAGEKPCLGMAGVPVVGAYRVAMPRRLLLQ